MSYFGRRKLGGARAVIALAALLGLAAVPSVAQASTAELGPASLDFPDTLVGVSSPDQQVFFTNDGPDPIDVGGVAIGGTDPSDFAVTVDNCTGVTSGASESCEMRVGFAPTERGDRSAELDVTHTGDGGLTSAPLSGKGVTKELTITPSQLDFPATTVNYPGGQQQLQVQNTGDQPVAINNVFIDGCPGLGLQPEQQLRRPARPRPGLLHQRRLLAAGRGPPQRHAPRELRRDAAGQDGTADGDRRAAPARLRAGELRLRPAADQHQQRPDQLPASQHGRRPRAGQLDRHRRVRARTPSGRGTSTAGGRRCSRTTPATCRSTSGRTSRFPTRRSCGRRSTASHSPPISAARAASRSSPPRPIPPTLAPPPRAGRAIRARSP